MEPIVQCGYFYHVILIEEVDLSQGGIQLTLDLDYSAAN